MEIDDREANERLGVSQHRVQALTRARRLPARQSPGAPTTETVGLDSAHRHDEKTEGAWVGESKAAATDDDRFDASAASRLISRVIPST